MTKRMAYQPTEKQARNWAAIKTAEMPTDDEFKAMWKRAHHGKVTGWGMGKRDWAISSVRNSADYQLGLWQGRVDAARGLDYSEDRSDKSYNLGYHTGYVNYRSNRQGWDAATRARFDATYTSNLEG